MYFLDRTASIIFFGRLPFIFAEKDFWTDSFERTGRRLLGGPRLCFSDQVLQLLAAFSNMKQHPGYKQKLMLMFNVYQANFHHVGGPVREKKSSVTDTGRSDADPDPTKIRKFEE